MDNDSKYSKIKSFICHKLIFLHEWMLNRPLIVSFIISSSSILFSFILVFLGDIFPSPFTLTYFDPKDHLRLTPLGIILCIICLAWAFILEASEKYYEFKKGIDATDAEAANYIRERVDSRIDAVCSNKYNTLMAQIEGIVKNNATPRRIISRPCEQLETITRELSTCLRSLLVHAGYNLNENDMYISIFYKFQSWDVWKQTDSAFPEIGGSIHEITASKNSTFCKTLESKNGVIFINDKEDGFQNDSYIPDKDDKYDESEKLKGSILCYRIICRKNGEDYITAVLSISTYDKRIEPSNIPEKVRNTRDNICKHIISVFEKRIQVELSLLYLSELYNEYAKNKRKIAVKTPEIQNISAEKKG